MSYFTNFTPENMRVFAEKLAEEPQRRSNFVRGIRDATHTMLARFQKERRNISADLRRNLAEHERQRRRQSEKAASARRVFMSELKSGANATLNLFRVKHREVAAELKTARDSWRHRGVLHLKGMSKSAQKQDLPQEVKSQAKFKGDEAAKSRRPHG